LSMIYTAPPEYFFTKMKLSLFGALFLAFPIIASQVYMFVAPGLYKNERRAFLPYLIATLNANVDLLQHPEIPYFDEEHILVGTIAGVLTLALFVLLELYFRSLEKAMDKIRSLEIFLSICANCKRVRTPGGDPEKKESWKPIDQYIEQNTQTRFSHGICPDCAKKIYPHYYQEH